MTVNALVLAGGRNSAAMKEASGVENRALTPLGTRAMLDYVVSALGQTPSVEQIYVVGDVPASPQYIRVAGGETLLDNLMAGLTAAGRPERMLVSTSDIPFVTAEALEDFVHRAVSSGADLCCSYVPLSVCTEKFPAMKRTAIKTAEGRFTLGNVILVNPQFLAANQAAIAQAYAARKSPIKVAKMLGVGMLARLIAAQTVSPRLLTVPMLEAAVSRLLGQGSRTAGICSSYAEIGTDIDSPEDIAIARAILSR